MLQPNGAGHTCAGKNHVGPDVPSGQASRLATSRSNSFPRQQLDQSPFTLFYSLPSVSLIFLLPTIPFARIS